MKEIKSFINIIEYINNHTMIKYLNKYQTPTAPIIIKKSQIILNSNGDGIHIQKIRGWLKYLIPQKIDQIKLWEILHRVPIIPPEEIPIEYDRNKLSLPKYQKILQKLNVK